MSSGSRSGAIAVIGEEFGSDRQLLAALDAIPCPHRPPVGLHRAGADPALQPGPRVLRQRRSQRLIEALAGGAGRQCKHVGLELRGHDWVSYTAAFSANALGVTST